MRLDKLKCRRFAIVRPAPPRRFTVSLVDIDQRDIAEECPELDQKRLRGDCEHGNVRDVSPLEWQPDLPVELIH